ncbi:MAG: hypothetical protein GOMPHAMPRED_004276 [Gomphillus americanus]|uniref:Anamorsin homolog n=1 Tax=Gomphillus americanus TaxID=1940652 RepID=A0A8H3FQ28_9LECA|nr:MAG: hypothetical protein GOMPHAMPRED_004276 [Gomphillus americanus]
MPVLTEEPPRTLLLSPPSLSAHPELLNGILPAHDRAYTDIQMLDRLSLNLVSLPPSTYHLILILTDADGTRRESQKLLSRNVLALLVPSLKPGGILKSQDGTFASTDSGEKNEAILAGLVIDQDGTIRKPESAANVAIPLRLGKRKDQGGATSTTVAVGTGVENITSKGTLPTNGNSTNGHTTNGSSAPAGVGFIDFSDDFDAPIDVDEDDDDDDDELIDEDTLLTEEDLISDIAQPPECRPKPGKRRRACKDCTCGLAQRLEAEDAARRSKADADLSLLNGTNGKAISQTKTVPKFSTADLDDAEVDFTVQGKVGSCGNCALGDAFRCDGCPYIGLPAFKPGEEVRLRVGEEGAL